MTVLSQNGHLVACLALLAGCAPAKEPAKSAPTVTDEPVERAPAATFTSQVGGMNQEAVERTFNRLQDEVLDCLERGSIEGVGGSLTLKLRIAMDGSVRWVHLSSSDLGDRTSERCVMDAARTRTWPKPKGGEGAISHTYTIESPIDVRVWEPKRLRSTMPQIRKQVWKCFGSVRGRFVATLYIGRDGRVASAGVAPPSPEADEKVDCLVDVLTTFKFGWQRAKLSKVTIKLP
jgi:hypothetical protein